MKNESSRPAEGKSNEKKKEKKPVRDWVRGVSKTPTGGWGQGHGVFFFPFFFGGGGIYLELDSFWTKKYLSVYNGKPFKELRNKWNCACDKLPSVGSFSCQNGHVVNHSRVFLS